MYFVCTHKRGKYFMFKVISVRHGKRILSVLLLMVMVFQTIIIQTYADTEETSVSLDFLDVNLDPVDIVPSGENFMLFMTIGGASSLITDTNIKPIIDLGDSKMEFLQFDDKGFTDGSVYSVSTASGYLTFVMRVRDDGTRYIEVDKEAVVEGSTIGVSFECRYPEGITNNGESTEVSLVTYDENEMPTVLANDNIKAEANSFWDHNKGSNYSELALNKNADNSYSLSNDIIFTITEYDSNKYNADTGLFDDNTLKDIGVIYTREFTVTDTYTFPEGMYIPSDADINTAVSVTNADGAEITPVVNGDKITGFVVKYTKTSTDETNQLTYQQPQVTINKDSVIINKDFKDGSAIITNLHTDYIDIFGQSNSIDEDVSVEVSLRLPREFDESLSNAIEKSIFDVADQYGTYPSWNTSPDPSNTNIFVVAGDVIIYKVTSTNNGDTTIYDHSFIDTIPDGLELVSIEEFEEVKDKFWNYSNQKLDTSSNSINAEGNNVIAWVNGNSNGVTGAGISYENGVFSFSAIEMKPGSVLEGYVALKVTDDSDVSIANVAKLTSNEYTKEDTIEINVHKKKPELKIKKSVSNTSVTVGEFFEYTVVIENTGTEDSFNSLFTDVLPEGVTYRDSVGISVEKLGNSTGNFVVENNAVTGENINLPIGGKIVIKIPVVANEEFENKSNVINTATLTDEYGISISSDASISKNQFNPNNFIITKTSDKEYAAAGDEITYKIVLKNNNGEFGKTYSEDAPLIVEDVLPEGLDYTAVVTPNGFTSSYDESTRKITFTFTGMMKPRAEFTFTVKAKVNENVKEGDKIVNIAVVKSEDGSFEKPSDGDGSSTDITGNGGGLLPSKKVYDFEGNDITDSHTLPDNNIGKKITFRVKVYNNSQTMTYNEMTVTDTLTSNGYGGSYSAENNKIEYKIIDTDKVNGIKEGDKYSKYVYYIGNPFIETLTFSATDEAASFYTDAFSMEPGGFIEFEYSLILNDGFTNGTNTAVVNGNNSTVNFGLLSSYPELELFKEASKEKFPVVEAESKEALAETLRNLSFDYNVKIVNNGKANYIDSNFKVLDVLPEGMMLNSEINAIYYYDQNYSEKLKYDVETIGNQFTINFENINIKCDEYNNGRNGFVNISYKTKLTEEMVQNLTNNAIIDNGKYCVQKTSFDNSVAISGSNEFLTPEGEIVTTETITTTITVVENTMHPGIGKQGLGSFAKSASHFSEIGSIVNAGDNIAWSIVVKNGMTADGDGIPMTEYTVKDVLPSIYTYMPAGEVNLADWEPSIVKTKADGTKEVLDYTDAVVKIDDTGIRSAVWEFKGGNYVLQPNEFITIEFATKLADGQAGVQGVITNQAQLNVAGRYIPENISSGFEIEGGIADNAVFNILSIATSSYKEIEYISDGHSYDPVYDKGDSRYNSPDNYVQGMQGENVTYTLNVTNSSNQPINQISIIDRLPFVGDIGVITGLQRESAFDVCWGGLVSAIVYNNDGTVYKDLSSETAISYSSDRTTTFNNENAEDWKGGSQLVTDWSDTASETTSLVRFMFPAEFEIPVGATVKIKFEGIVPEVVTNTGENNIAWNNFGYSYSTTKNIIQNLIAEPAKVGVWVLGSKDNGKITVDKTYISDNSSKDTFYFGVFTKKNGIYKLVASQKLSMTGSPDGITGSVNFENLPYDIKDGTEYYVFETDINGNILNEGKNDLINVSYDKNNVVLNSESNSAVVGIKNVELTTESTTESTTETTTEETTGTEESTTEGTTTTESSTETTTEETTAESTTEDEGGNEKPTESTTIVGPT